MIPRGRTVSPLGAPAVGTDMTRGWETEGSSASAGSDSQERMLSSSPFWRGMSNFSPHCLQRADRPCASTGRRYFAPQWEHEHLIVVSKGHLTPIPRPVPKRETSLATLQSLALSVGFAFSIVG